MMVGDMLALAQRSSTGFADWLEREDPGLAARCREAAEGQSLDRWLRGAVSWFELHGSADDWATLTSRIRESAAPGHALLATMVERRLSPCNCAEKGHAA